MGGLGAVLEPAVVVGLLVGGTFVNRNKDYKFSWNKSSRKHVPRLVVDEEIPGSPSSWATDDALLFHSAPSSPSLRAVDTEPEWRTREVKIFGIRKTIVSPNTRVFKDRRFSRLMRKLPFIREFWYWGVIYWVYQLGRAFTAVTIVEGTVHVARKHALQVVHAEQLLHIFWEIPIQKYFLTHPDLLIWINRIYSFIHIPGTIIFLIGLYYYTTTSRPTLSLPTFTFANSGERISRTSSPPRPKAPVTGTALYEARRRTMATCNLIAFIVFTLWPCMPPRLLSDQTVTSATGAQARSYGFVDTVHGDGGEGSVWTQNKFCNQYAAMPSLHFGYSLLIGLTVLTLPLHGTTGHRRSESHYSVSLKGSRIRIPQPDWRRVVCVIAGVGYPLMILVAIVATANHFILDAVAGAMVCGIAWWGNGILLNLLPLEDWFLWCLRAHFEENGVVGEGDDEITEKKRSIGGKS